MPFALFPLLVGFGSVPLAGSKPGRCPSEEDPAGEPSVLYCFSDASCPATEKCCRLGPMQICVQPAMAGTSPDHFKGGFSAGSSGIMKIPPLPPSEPLGHNRRLPPYHRIASL
uniref:WAP domain-containing protein n=1 Tax=Salvator merianae TaxID=96440 RepID=A0A8D0C5E0_SALMN